MIKIELKLLKMINSADRKNFNLVNSVGVMNNGDIVVADGYNDRICLINSNGFTKNTIGAKGYGKYKFKEPVGVFVSPEQLIYVTDWHNHRVVIYDENLSYVNEFGDIRLNLNKKLTAVKQLVMNLAYRGTYRKHHFLLEQKSTKLLNKYSFVLFIQGLYYILVKNKYSFYKILSQEITMNKPNGIGFLDDNIVVSEKNNRCLTIFEHKNYRDFTKINQISKLKNGLHFGRLGNITVDKYDNIFVCDEQNHRIIILNKYFEFIKHIEGEESVLGRGFLPFSCCSITEEIIAVCGGHNIQFIDTNSNTVIYVSEEFGELHGLAYDARNKLLYVADRSRSNIMKFSLSYY